MGLHLKYPRRIDAQVYQLGEYFSNLRASPILWKKLFFWCFLVMGSPADFFKAELPVVRKNSKIDAQLNYDVVRFSRIRCRSLGGLIPVSAEVPVSKSPYDGERYEESMWKTITNNWEDDQYTLDVRGEGNQASLETGFNRRLRALSIPVRDEMKVERPLPMSLKVLWDLRAWDLLANKGVNLAVVNRIGGFLDERTLWRKWAFTSQFLKNAPISKLY